MKRHLLFILLLLSANISFSQTENTVSKLSLKGQAITTINNKIIQQNYGRTLAQLLNEQPGIVINGAYQPNGSLIAIYMEGTLSARALILIDNIPVWDPSGIPDCFDINLISLYDIESIDIYHGTQCSTMGNGAFAGAININTIRKKDNKPFHFTAIQSIGNQNTLNSNAQIWGNNNKWIYSVAYTHISTDGFSLAYDSIGHQGFDKEAFTGNFLNSNVTYNINKYLQWKANCLYTIYKSGSDVDAYMDTKDYFYTKKYLKNGTGFIYNKNHFLLQGNYQYSNSYSNYHYDNEFHEIYEGRTHFAEMFLQTSIFKRFKLLTGTDYSNGYMHSDFYDTTNEDAHVYPQINMYGIYGKTSYVSKDSSLGIDIVYRAMNHSAYGWVNSYNLSGTYTLTKEIAINGGISAGYKSPCLFQLYSNYGGANSALLPEKTIDYHIGIAVKNNYCKQSLRLFYYTQKELIYWDNYTGSYDNFNHQNTWGLQYELDYNITAHLSITANYSLTKGSDYSIGRINYSDTITYPYLFRRPEHIVNGGIHYSNKMLSIGITARYVSDWYDVNFGKSDYIMNHFVLFNAYLKCTINKHWQLFANTQNMLNNTFYDVKGLNSIPLLINGGVKFQL